MVEGPVRTLQAVAMITFSTGLFASTGTGCVDVGGGAAELSWSIFDFTGKRIDNCADAAIDKVRLCWEPVEAGAEVTSPLACTEGQWKDTPCEDNRAVTDFSIDSGSHVFWIVPLCAGGVVPDADTYEVPPPLLRNVAPGSVVTLNSQLIVAHRNATGTRCSDTCPCAAESRDGMPRPEPAP